ncbi:MAG: hypothetical protein JOZ43_08845 [Acidobacteriales bacterium]|nr:hypothetical protein [Terriglobales bacterium]
MASKSLGIDPSYAATEDCAKLVEISSGYWLPRALHVAADLGIADHIADTPRTAASLAQDIGADPGALDRLMRLLASEGVFTRQNGLYAHNPISRLLRTDHPQSMRAYVQLLGMPLIWNSWTDLTQAVKTAWPITGDIFTYMAQHPDEASLFDRGMKSKAQSAIPPALNAYDFSQFHCISDIGGGLGHLLRAILHRCPGTKGVLFDQPHVIERAKADGTIDGRLSLDAGDFFTDPLPQSDAYLLMEVLHDWSDEQCTRILQQIRTAAHNDSKLLIIETVLPDEKAWADGRAQHFGHHLDINMLVVTGGRERSPEQFRELLSSASWRLNRVLPTPSAYSVVEAVTA